jgi:hypothetical protein
MNIGEQSSTGILTCQDLVSRGKIKWTEFDPPLTGGGGNQNLAGVLATGNDANAQDVLNVGKITMTGGGDVGLQIEKSITGVSNLACQNMTTTFATALESSVGDELTMGTSGGSGGIIQFDPNGAPGSHAINGASETNRCVLTNCDFTSATNTFPTSIDDDTLGDVMLRGNTASATLNMNGELITNCQTIGTSEVATPLIQFSSTVGTLLNGSNNPGNPTVCNNLDFVSGTGNIFPASVAGDLEATLQLGNDANGQNITGVNTLTATAVDSTAIDNTGILATGSLLTSSVGVQCNTIAESPAVVDLSSGVTGGQAELNFSGRAGSVGQDTFIKGDVGLDSLGNIKRTRATHLDLTDSSNLHPPPTEERYEWMSVWTNAKTIFPSPPYADGSTTQIPTINLVHFDFNTIDLDRTPQWRYFAPQSDSDCVIDPDDHLQLHEGEYIGNRGGSNPTAWQYAFYGTTAATTIPAHASQVVEFSFPSTYYGYGRIYMALAAHGPPYTTEPIVYYQTFRLIMEHEGSTLSNNERINGPVVVKWYCKDMFPTDGTQWRVYPLCRVDDARHYGRLQINIGNGEPLDGCNPGNPPDFTPTNTNAQNGQLILRGYPLPAQFMEMENVAPP